MSFGTRLRRILVGIVVKPWRLMWVILVAAGDVWLTDHASSASFGGWAVRMLIRVLALALAAPVYVSALHDARHDRGAGDPEYS